MVLRRSLSLCLFLAGVLSPAALWGDPLDDVRSAVMGLERTLPADEAGASWRRFLMLDELEAQIQHAGSVDVDLVEAVHERFAREHEVLARPPFVAMRDAIARWLESLQGPSREELPSYALAFRDAFTPAGEMEVRLAARTAQEAAAQLDRRLAALGQVESGWRVFLRWNDLSAALDRHDPSDVSTLRSVANRCSAAAPVLQTGEVRKMEGSLRSLIARILLRQTTEPMYRERIDAVADALESLANSDSDLPRLIVSEAIRPEADASGSPGKFDQHRPLVAETLGWLAERELAPELIEAVRRWHSQPNLRVEVSSRLLGAPLDTTINATTQASDVIRGTRYTGTNQTTGALALEMIPDPRQLALLLRYDMTIAGTSTGRNGNVVVRSGSTTNVAGHKMLTLSDQGLRVFPSTASASTTSTIYDVSAGGPIGRPARIRAVHAGKAATERDVARRTEDRVKTQIDHDVHQALTPVREDFQYDVLIPLAARGSFPRRIQLSTTENFGHLSLVQAGPDQLGAPAPPEWTASRRDLYLQLHESFLDNLAGVFLPGRTYNEQDITRAWERAFGVVPEALRTESAEEPWTVTFADMHPLRITLGSDALTVTLRASAFTVGEQAYPGMIVTAAYALSPESAGLIGARQDRLGVEPLDVEAGEKLAARQQVFRSIVRRRFDRVFPEKLNVYHLPLPAAWQRAGRLRIDTARARDGWLTLSCMLAAAEDRNGR